MISLLLSIFSNIFFVSYVHSKSFLAPLSKEDEQLYLQKKANGDMHARDKLIEHNLRLVAHIAKKYENNKDLQEDLISIGTIGLIKAIDNYKLDHKTKLATFAARCIENEILMHLRTNKKSSLDISLSEPIAMDKDGSEIVLGDIVACHEIDLIDEIDKKDSILKLIEYFDLLSSREKKTLIMRYGLFNTKKYTQVDISKQLKISRSYVSRLEKRALIKLYKEFLKEENKIKKNDTLH